MIKMKDEIDYIPQNNVIFKIQGGKYTKDYFTVFFDIRKEVDEDLKDNLEYKILDILIRRYK